jgi:outer membrane cobalamin receptor
MYTQAQKKLMDDRLKLTGSIRYDKSQNFDGNYSPRISAVYSAGSKKNHTFRGSFQTGFRNPTTQDQYIGFNVGNAVLVGSAPDNLIRYSETLTVNNGADGQGISYAGGSTVTINGNNAYYNSYTSASITSFLNRLNGPLQIVNGVQETPAQRQSDAYSMIKKTNVGLVKPETVKAIELGYRGQIKGFSFDINGYYNVYNNFLGNLTVVAPLYGTAVDNPLPYAGLPTTNPGTQSIHALFNGNTRAYQLYTNTNIEINSLGVGLGVSRKVYKDFELSANYNYAQFDFDQSKDPSFEAGFNTPKHRAKASISNDKLFKNFGFNLSARWNDEYKWESTFADGMIDAATVIDAQVSYSLPKLKSVLKIGAANLGGNEYRQVLGAGLIGQQYFASLTINP